MIKPHLYCNCYENQVNKRTEYLQTNLMLGSIFYDPTLKSSLFQRKFIFDDTGDNISHLNKWFGQLTGLYWVWKNTSEDIIGTNTYRLYWGDYFIKNDFKSNVLYIPHPLDVNKCFNDGIKENVNLYYQYSYCHGLKNLDFLYEISNKNKIPIKTWMIDDLKNQYLLNPFNMFISERKIFNRVCDILFDTIFEYYSSYKNYFDEISKQTGQKRILDFLSERILHMIYHHKEYFLSDIDIETISVIDLKHDEQ